MVLEHLFELVADGRFDGHGYHLWICPVGKCRSRIVHGSDAARRDRLALEHSLDHAYAGSEIRQKNDFDFGGGSDKLLIITSAR